MSVRTCRMDDFSWSSPIAYVKMDVEGAEQLVIRGSALLLEAFPPLVWSFECIGEPHENERLLSAFRDYRYKLLLWNPDSQHLVPYEKDQQGNYPPRKDDNILAIHDSAVNIVAQRLCGLD
jgi:hypothetical protein